MQCIRVFLPVVLASLATAVVLTVGPASGASNSSQYIAPDAGTSVPVYDTAWQMLVLASPAEADQYFAELQAYGFTGTWAGVIHHAPATYAHPFNGGGTVATVQNGNIVLTPEYIAHVNTILDAADGYGRKVGLVAAWQNLYLPGGGADSGHPVSNTVRGTIDENNAYAYGQQLVAAFGDHPAVSMWVFGGDAGTNNTEANKEVWRVMANAVRDAGSTLDITYHTPTSPFDQLNYAGEPWLDFIAPETGHGQHASETEAELLAAAAAYQLPVWQGEPRYFNINFNWVPAAFRNPGVAEVEADALAARNAGVAGYVYGDAGRWNWCRGWGDSSPCTPGAIAESFGAGEEAVIDVFRVPGGGTGPTCNGLAVTVDLSLSQVPTAGDDVILGTAGDDVIAAMGGNDTICALDGDDIVAGGSGDDWVDAGNGADSVFGLDGADTLFGGPGMDVIVAGNGDDMLLGDDDDDTLNGGVGNDTIYGGSGDDLVFGQSGNDTLQGGDGNDEVLGSAGVDTVYGGNGDDVLNGGSGNDTVSGGLGSDLMFGLTGDDHLSGDDGNDTIFGQLGQDQIFGGHGDDQLLGNEDDDTISDPSGTNTINGGAGNDTLTGGSGIDNIFGDGNLAQAGNDTIDGGLGADLLLGFAGQDAISADDGVADTVNGGPGLDTCTTDAVDTVFNCP